LKIASVSWRKAHRYFILLITNEWFATEAAIIM